MFRAKIRGPLLRHLHLTYKVHGFKNAGYQSDEDMESGDIEIHIRLGWKSLAAFGVIVIQAAVNLFSDQLHLF